MGNQKTYYWSMLAYRHPYLLFLIPSLDDFRGASDGDAFRRDVVGDSGMAADDAAVADGDAGEDRAEFADPDVVLDDDGFALRQGALGRRDVRAVGMGAAVDAVVVVGNVDLAAHEDVVADLDVMHTADVDVLAKAHVVADNEARCEVLRRLALAVLVNRLQPEPSPGSEMPADLHALRAIDSRIRIHIDVPSAKDQP